PGSGGYPRGSNNARRNDSPPRQGTAGSRASSGNSEAARSGCRSHRPPSAELNQRDSTTESSDDATYGRSLTYWSSAPPLPPRPRTIPTGSTSSKTAAVHASSVASG